MVAFEATKTAVASQLNLAHLEYTKTIVVSSNASVLVTSGLDVKALGTADIGELGVVAILDPRERCPIAPHWNSWSAGLTKRRRHRTRVIRSRN